MYYILFAVVMDIVQNYVSDVSQRKCVHMNTLPDVLNVDEIYAVQGFYL